MVPIPGSLDWLRQRTDGRAWLAALPQLVEECAARWQLTVGVPYEGGAASLAVPGQMRSGESVVLKVQFPDRESEPEAAALAAWGGEGAVRLLAHDAQRRALLVEHCAPGTPLSAQGPAEALRVLIGLIPRMAIPSPAGIGTLGEEASRWRRSLRSNWEAAGRPFEARLLDAAEELDPGPLGEAVGGADAEAVLLHQDLHGDNVLSAQREPWLVIDPKPLNGDPAFQAAPIVRSAELGTSRADVTYRLNRLCDELGFDRERVRAWTLAQTLAWSFENGEVHDWHLQLARWLAE